jgi:hypothetical protein
MPFYLQSATTFSPFDAALLSAVSALWSEGSLPAHVCREPKLICAQCKGSDVRARDALQRGSRTLDARPGLVAQVRGRGLAGHDRGADALDGLLRARDVGLCARDGGRVGGAARGESGWSLSTEQIW